MIAFDHTPFVQFHSPRVFITALFILSAGYRKFPETR
jgi:hypothetical protein